MRSTFSGLEIARRGMMTQQGALYTTGHNIANANTPGYSRQRVNFVQTAPYPAPSVNRPAMPGQVGTGVEAGSIQRVRDHFLDEQYRVENNKLGYWESKKSAIQKMEDILNEPTEDGLAATLDRFWTSLQDLAAHPEDAGARSVVRQRGIAVTDTFHYLSNSISAIQKDFKKEVTTTQNEINTLLSQINMVNKQVGEIEPHGFVPNDLYDERDRLVDQLSQLINIRVERVPSGGSPNGAAEGKLNIFLADPQGGYANGNSGTFKLVDAKEYTNMTIDVEFTSLNPDSPIQSINFLDHNGLKMDGISGTNFTDLKKGVPGKMQALVEMYGYTTGPVNVDGTYPVNGVYNKMLEDLDKMAYVFAQKFNEVHQDGYTLNDINAHEADPIANPLNKTTIEFFTLADSAIGQPWRNAAKRIEVSNDIINNEGNIAASADKSAGNGGNAIALANVKDAELNYKNPLVAETSTIQGFYQGLIGALGVAGIEAIRMEKNSLVLKDSVQYKRDSVSNVSLDEEMTNMIKFQHAYNAAARNITLVDELLDKVINGMGIVGR
ncbi:flagellar hook-associated protein FlgK [Bacillus salitolerans]|uniref:Flagellar hook-associated protein 1 n=1 Tax=Bacillus salitolerans TaxID=1437434 RepID=A0ABW4LNP0_9BACI